MDAQHHSRQRNRASIEQTEMGQTIVAPSSISWRSPQAMHMRKEPRLHGPSHDVAGPGDGIFMTHYG